MVFFVSNPAFQTSYTAISSRSRKMYEFGSYPVAVDDPVDIERFRAEMVNGKPRLIETDARGKPLQEAGTVDNRAPRSFSTYKGAGRPAATPRSAPAEAPFVSQTGVLPSGVPAPSAPARSAVRASGPDPDDDDLGEAEVIRRRAAKGIPTRR